MSLREPVAKRKSARKDKIWISTPKIISEAAPARGELRRVINGANYEFQIS